MRTEAPTRFGFLSPIAGGARRAATMLLLLGLLGAAGGAETVLYETATAPDAWALAAEEHRAVTADDPVISFTDGQATLRLEAPGGHVIRIRYRATYTAKMDASAWPLTDGQRGQRIPLSGHWTFAHARPDPLAVELGFVMPPTAIEFELVFNSKGTVTLAGLQVFDLGPVPTPEIDPEELLSDPGWEATPERAAIPDENPYHRTLNGWMGWAKTRTDTHAVTPVPSRVRSGRRAIMVSATGGGIRQGERRANSQVKLGRCYAFSVWAKGHGLFRIYSVNLDASPEYVVSPDEWRQFHLPICVDNPAVAGFSIGLMVRGRIFFDDFSLREVPRDRVEELRHAADDYLAGKLPPRVVQTSPAGEERPAEPVVLENDRVRAVISPVGGARVTALTDKTTGRSWTDIDALGIDFGTQPVPIDWRAPFRVDRHGDRIVFSHTVTGGEAAVPFLDGVRIEQEFVLYGAVLSARLRLANSSEGVRLPQPGFVNSWPPDVAPTLSAYGSKLPAGYVLQATHGQAGLFVTVAEAVELPQPIAGWAAGSGDDGSLVFGFAPRAVTRERLDPAKRELTWGYPRLTLPPGGAWDTSTFLAPTTLDQVAYADRDVAVKVVLEPVAGADDLRLTFAAEAFTTGATVRARVVDYGGNPVTAVGPEPTAITFTPPPGSLITLLDIVAGDRRETVELFNDLPGRVSGSGIHGAGQIQYAPTVPARVIDLPAPGDLRPELAAASEVLWCYGLFSHLYPFEKLLVDRGLDVKMLANGGGFPQELEELLDCRLVIISNLGATHFSANARAALSQYVRGGGALLVTGGTCGLGNAGTTGTDLEALLPAMLPGAFDCQPLPEDQRRLTGEFRGEPRLYWAHRIVPRDDAQIAVSAGDAPIILAHRVGHGRVMLFAGTVEGAPAPGETAAWEWVGWPRLWQRLLETLLTE